MNILKGYVMEDCQTGHWNTVYKVEEKEKEDCQLRVRLH